MIRRKDGFTLMEVMIAITILFVGAVGLVTLLNYVVVSVSTSTNQLIAANLAQEGIEAVRNSRDKSSSWASWYSSVVDGEYRVEVDRNVPYTGFILRERGATAPETFFPLEYDTNLGFYNHEGVGEPTIFSRRVTITELYPASPREKKVVTEVWWTERGKTYTFSMENRLHFWWYK